MSVSYLLNTSVILGLITHSPWSRWTMNEFDFTSEETTILTSIVSCSEISKLAKQRGRKGNKLERLDELLHGHRSAGSCVQDFVYLSSRFRHCT